MFSLSCPLTSPIQEYEVECKRQRHSVYVHYLEGGGREERFERKFSAIERKIEEAMAKGMWEVNKLFMMTDEALRPFYGDMIRYCLNKQSLIPREGEKGMPIHAEIYQGIYASIAEYNSYVAIVNAPLTMGCALTKVFFFHLNEQTKNWLIQTDGGKGGVLSGLTFYPDEKLAYRTVYSYYNG